MNDEKADQTPWEFREFYNPFFSDRNAMKKFVWQLENENSNWQTVERMVRRESIGSIEFQLTYFIWLQLTKKIKVSEFNEKGEE